mgnify:CR=1 FL=1
MNIVITGGASGLGRAITDRLVLDPNNKLLISYSNSASVAEAMAAEHENLSVALCNFKEPESVQAFCTTVKDFDVDILINNAFCGITTKHFHKMPKGTFLSSFQQSVVPTLEITQAMLSICRKKKQGKIITILSSYLKGLPPIGLSEYVANKAYLYSMHKSWVRENTKFNILFYCLSPSFMQTPLNADVDERILEGIKKASPLNKILTVEEVAESILFLCNGSDHLNGINLYMNSGDSI